MFFTCYVLFLGTLARFCQCGSIDQLYGNVVEMAAPMVHNLVAAGSLQCENLKHLLGITYDQVQSRRAAPNLEKELTIDLFTHQETVKINVTTAVEDILKSPYFKRELETIILVPGFMESSQGLMVQTIAKELLNAGGYNVLALDGTELVRFLYFQSTTNIRFMGTKLGEVLAGMVSKGVDPDRITIIGHSLGAHISGIAGKEFERLTQVKIGRITGLDPAGPCFTSEDIVRLGKGDAGYVDVIHTDGGLLGLKEELGNKDFYPNGGSIQPGCPVVPGCCHSRAWEYFAESIRNPDAFLAQKCESWQHFKSGNCDHSHSSRMGLYSTDGADGNYFLTTSSENSAYGLGRKGMTIK